jgi:hypothetical protein
MYHYEITNTKADVVLTIEEFMPLSSDRIVFSMVIYGVDEYNRLNWYKFNTSSIAIPFKKLLLKGFERVYLDFFRHEEKVESSIKINIAVNRLNGMKFSFDFVFVNNEFIFI